MAQLALVAGDTNTQVEQIRIPSHSTGVLCDNMMLEASKVSWARRVVESAETAEPGTVPNQRQDASGKVDKQEPAPIQEEEQGPCALDTVAHIGYHSLESRTVAGRRECTQS